MSYHGIIAERRLWAGSPGVEFSVAAVMLADGSTEIETRYITHGTGRPLVGMQRRIPLATAFWLADAVQCVVAEASTRIETHGDREDREEHIYAEELCATPDGWLRVRAAAHYGTPFLRVDWGVEIDAFDCGFDVLLELPFVRALELHTAITGAALVAFNSLTPTRELRE